MRLKDLGTYNRPHVSLIRGWGKIFLAEQLTLTWCPVGNCSCWKVTLVAGAEREKVFKIQSNTGIQYRKYSFEYWIHIPRHLLNLIWGWGKIFLVQQLLLESHWSCWSCMYYIQFSICSSLYVVSCKQALYSLLDTLFPYSRIGKQNIPGAPLCKLSTTFWESHTVRCHLFIDFYLSSISEILSKNSDTYCTFLVNVDY